MNKPNFFTINYAAILGIVYLLVFLKHNAHMNVKLKKLFKILLSLEVLEMLVYSAELITATLTYPTFLRVLLSVIGYSVRPILPCIILIITLRNSVSKKWTAILCIPAIINIIIASTAFFSGICFSYTAENEFVRGALGYCPHIVLLIYLIAIVVFTIKKSLKHNHFEQLIIYLMCATIAGSIIIEAVFKVRDIGRTSMVLCTVFYYMFFQTNEYMQKIEHENRQIEGLINQNKLDPMTEFLNKDAFSIICTDNFKKYTDKSITLLFIDLDHFKQVNDTLGHLEGDKAIISSALQIAKTFSDEDLLCRFGGDEFCVCLRGVTYEQLCKLLHTACQNLHHEHWTFNHEKRIVLTASIGAVYCENGKNVNFDKLIAKADRAVYKAKNTGRDKFIIDRM